jgi:Do/DeqQ family serine protease
VVFVKVMSKARSRPSANRWFYNFFEDPRPVSSFGSGVIISQEGYIVTNRHVVENADSIEIALSDQRAVYPATLVGSDPSTDLAVLKVDAQGLPEMEFGDSDALDIGEWVLAVGNPFNLTSTVTTGIVSAKGRNLDVVDNAFPIESFIQTDAAINPGNSGGALVNLEGKLVGINTAILSQTGSYAGYGFAIPSNIVAKVADDIIQYGLVQRAFLEAEVKALERTRGATEGAASIEGVRVAHVDRGGNADQAGLQTGDIITAVNGKSVNSPSAFSEQLAYYRPGDQITLQVLRNGKTQRMAVELVNAEGKPTIIQKPSVESKTLGASFQDLTKMEKKHFGTPYGVKVTEIRGGAIQQMGLAEGFIITSINNRPAKSAEEVVAFLENVRGRILLEGLSPQGKRKVYSYYIY